MTQDIAELPPAAFNGTADATPPPETAAAALPLETATPAGDISAREAVRRALAELGADAELDDVLAHVHNKFGLCPPRGTVQTYVCLARKDARDGTPSEPRRRGRPRKANSNGQPAAPAALDEVIDAVEILRDLCDRLGDDNVRRLLDAL